MLTYFLLLQVPDLICYNIVKYGISEQTLRDDGVHLNHEGQKGLERVISDIISKNW